MKIKIPDNPIAFFKSIPTDPKENINWRIELNKLCAVDRKAQAVVLYVCKEYIPNFFNSVAWTLNPWTRVNHPFILRPRQIPAVETLNECIITGHDVGINKSREEGASEICCKLFAAHALLHEYSNFIVGSRKKELVDNFGDFYTLFAKIDNVFECLPSWWLELCGYNPKNNRKDMLLTIPSNNSSIVGETTNESFSAGSRATALLLDEFGRVDASTATAIEGSVHDVSPCIIYSSTHWLGSGHCFNQCLTKATTTVVELLWYNNPTKNQGLYTSPEPGKFEIIDKDYYSNTDLEEAIVLTNISDYDVETERVQFVADGCGNLPKPLRSPWHDYQQRRREGNRRDFISNIWATPLGASETPFDHEMLQRIKSKDIRHPDYIGDIKFKQYSNGLISPDEVYFEHQGGFGKLKWWGRLPYGRPDQRHNYIIAVDPSYGLGSANSAAVIYDRNTSEQVGAWTDANTKPEALADLMVALAYWCGGINPAYIIWDTGGGCGSMFTNRLVFHRYPYVYTQKREDSKTRKITKKWGFMCTGTKVKDALLGELGVALSSGLIGNDEYKSIIIHDEELLSELFDYVFRESGAGAVVSKKADLSTGALERHGDRVIAAGLCVLACKEQFKGDWKTSINPPYGSFQQRFNKANEQLEKEKFDARTFLF
jgi:hypothetical protein